MSFTIAAIGFSRATKEQTPGVPDEPRVIGLARVDCNRADVSGRQGGDEDNLKWQLQMGQALGLAEVVPAMQN
jgi:hypothetical protein